MTKTYNSTCRTNGALRRCGLSSADGDGGTMQTTGELGRIFV